MSHTIQEMLRSLLCFGGVRLDINFSNPRVELEEASLRQRRGRKRAGENGRGHQRAQGTLAMLCHPQFPEQQGLPQGTAAVQGR